ncbi:hypothetical protein SAMN05660462_00756 [Proteiniborus ethanoligenes]|uniref:Uncharacterized protein n=1 Tax=Proteiniborus ethanoligenes TaxID=415015 RepID=A0A1H3M9B4_9FIRM|nr:YeeE/YedE thiosulfate transporter family protein [Proteiniborus ethanoligenes]SDY73302.1 hypothetical protein SAMN05660462_00756 [Proteiniborus ethanoligenes]
MNLNDNKFYLKWFKNSWTYVTGAILLSLFQIVTLAVTGEAWRISSTLTNWGAWIYEALGGNVSSWFYFSSESSLLTLQEGFLKDPKSIRNIGIIVGALLSALMASQFKFRKIKSKKQIIGACIGGLLMGYGSRLASGCNIGALYSGIASLSLAGWVFGLFIFIGAIIGSKLIIRYFL